MTLEENIPFKSDNYLYAESIFFEQFNECNFFVEDYDQEELYFLIMKKLFPDVKISKIFTLNGKDQLIAHCRENTNSSMNIYILDKDFDDLLNKKELIDNLFYLKCYSIENYLLENKAIIAFIISEKPNLNRKKIYQRFDPKNYIKYLSSNFSYLFYMYFLAQLKLSRKIKNCKISPEEFRLKNNRAQINLNRIKSYENELYVALKNENINIDIKEDYSKNESLFNRLSEDNLTCNISGKYLLSFLQDKIKRVFKCSQQPLDSFRYRLAQQCDFYQLDYLKIGITNYLSHSNKD